MTLRLGLSLSISINKDLVIDGGGGAPSLIEHVQNGDMQSAVGWSGTSTPSGGVLDIAAGTTAINTLSPALQLGVEYTLKYTATILSGTPTGTISLWFVRSSEIVVLSIVANGAEQTEVFTASGDWAEARIVEAGSVGSWRFTNLSITSPA